MENIEFVAIILIALTVLLWITWIAECGLLRASMAILLRVCWVAPIIFAFFPLVRSENVTSALSLEPINILLDDSTSMKSSSLEDGSSPFTQGLKIVDRISKECLRLGCLPNLTLLSELDKKTKDGYTPLSNNLEPWLYKTGGGAWILISDGGDYRPSLSWDNNLKGAGLLPNGDRKGVIIGFKPKDFSNILIETSDTPVFSFEDKPLEILVSIKRERKILHQETIQVQILAKDTALASINASFGVGEDLLETTIIVPPLIRGVHLLTIKALPTSDETGVWDNVTHKIVEVLPNTVGLLHLLGAPSWDGRFLRRYIKSEPKFDSISFFILRDRRDSQLTNERELSLIPFPVDRLFDEELVNFRAVIMQNFALYEFLDYQYQENLVKFVKDGGGILFIGGPRALQSGDSGESPLASILPFTSKSRTHSGFIGSYGDRYDEGGPFYDHNLKFKIELAQPNLNQRALATVFNEWESIADLLSEQTDLKGLHHMENVDFKEGEYTPLLNARLENGEVRPLVVASYPGKGRAIWIFSDSLYRVALNGGEWSSGHLYQNFMKSAMTWLLRKEIEKPLILRKLSISENNVGGMGWKFNLVGPASKYFQDGPSWKLSICGLEIKERSIVREKISSENWLISGNIPIKVLGGKRCEAKVVGNNPAFGSVEALTAAVVPETFMDRDIVAAPNKLVNVSKLTGSDLIFSNDDKMEPIMRWLESILGRMGIGYPMKIEKKKDHYWPLSYWWFWVLLLAIPVEVLVRRWPELTAMKVSGEKLHNKVNRRSSLLKN